MITREQRLRYDKLHKEVRRIIDEESERHAQDPTRVAFSARKTKGLRLARKAAMARIYRESGLGLSLSEVGVIFNGRDHTTVLHAVRTYYEEDSCQSNPASDSQN